MTEGHHEDFKNRLRLDIKFEVHVDPQTGQERLYYVLDPIRYKVVEGEKELMVVDQLDHWAMPLREIKRIVEEGLTRMPTGNTQQLGNAREYIQERQLAIRERLKQGDAPPYKFVDRSEEFLSQLPDGVHGFAVISIDLVGSTILSNVLDPVINASLISVILEELAAVAPYFHAHILKFTGDGVLAYIPPPSFLTANDNAIDCALTMRGLIRDGINPVFAEFGYPTIDVRVGIESGAAVAMTVGHPDSKRQRDLIGQTLNLACKIQASGKSGEIRIGQVAYQNMHTMWKLGSVLAESPEDWAYQFSDGQPYPIHLFIADGAVVE